MIKSKGIYERGIAMGRIGKKLCLYFVVFCLIFMAVSPFYGQDTVLAQVQDSGCSSEIVSLSDASDISGQNIIPHIETQDNDGEYIEADEKPVGFFPEKDSQPDENIPAEESSVTAQPEPQEGIFSVSADRYNSQLPEGTELKKSELLFFSDNIGSLSSADSVNIYSFSLTERGMFSFVITHDALGALEGWQINLYEEYYINGDGKDKGYRLLNTLRTTSGSTKDKSPEIGLMPGNFILSVSCGDRYTSEAYSIAVFAENSYEYEIECNDNIYRYTELFSGVPMMGSASYFPDRQDEDWYLFRVYEDGFSELKFRHPAVKDKTTVCWQIILYDEEGTVLYSANSAFSSELTKSGGLGLCAGNYYIAVKNRVYTDMTYTLTFTRTDDMGYEDEQNDTKESANPIALNTTIAGSVTAKANGLDRDYFKFTVSEPGYAIIEFAHDPIEDAEDKKGWNFVLTDVNGNLLYKGISAWADDVLASSFTGLGAGTYYICVDSEKLYHNSEMYYLTVSFVTATDWESEFNGYPENADALVEGVPVNGVLSEQGTDFDSDYFSFSLAEQSDIRIILAHEVLEGNKEIFSFRLYDEDGYVIPTDNGKNAISSTQDAETATGEYLSLPPGEYHVRVTSGIFYENIPYALIYTLL